MLLLAVLPARAAPPSKRVCVEIKLQQASEEVAGEAPGRQAGAEQATGKAASETGQAAEKASEEDFAARRERVEAQIQNLLQAHPASTPFLPLGQSPLAYLKRLFEHFVTHEKGYEAVQEDCQERIVVELYPLTEGWTAFARYSGNGREERVDQLYAEEISQFAERAVEALLGDVPISATIKRDTVLRADSMKSAQRIQGTHHFILNLGTQVRGGRFDTAPADPTATVSDTLRVFSPMTIAAGYRGRFENWGLEAVAQVGIGTSRTAAKSNQAGGHIDFGGDVGLALHFLHYLQPRGIHSFYWGGGANFELLWFSAIKPVGVRNDDDRSLLLGGGLDVDLLCGWEFMRASAVQFYLQGELNLPAYVIDNEDNYGAIHTWFPTLSVKLGISF
ncbi:MAG: hypothetical protein DRI34_05825 [Deltaproteobacteria bacterium]|nr:MAG: hypothetical protein DRI34_05825 [Deltaproteobacteria bacterium]